MFITQKYFHEVWELVLDLSLNAYRYTATDEGSSFLFSSVLIIRKSNYPFNLSDEMSHRQLILV